MKTYHRFIITIFSKSFLFVFFVMFSLVLILNILSELEFFRNINVSLYLPIYISILNSPSLIFEMFHKGNIILCSDDKILSLMRKQKFRHGHFMTLAQKKLGSNLIQVMRGREKGN